MDNLNDTDINVGGVTGNTAIPIPSAGEGYDQETIASLGLMVQFVLLGVVFCLGHVLRRNKIIIVHEAGAALLLGVVVGLFVKMVGQASGFSQWINFNNNFFFYFLLPPIIFESGWSLQTELGADGNLYSLVFGESVLNDAVAIVMYKTVLAFVYTPINERGVFLAIWFFIVIFVGSTLIGGLVGMLSALVFRFGGFSEKGLHVIECCLACLFPYIAYMLANACQLSGIVAILFCGIAMRHYTHDNLSEEAQKLLSGFFSMLAKLSETFVFIYQGVALFLNPQAWDKSLNFTVISIFAILLARLLNVYPCAWVINMFRPADSKIPSKHQHALWYGGLRGAMAFALSLQSVTDLPDGHGKIFLTTTLFTVLFTVLTIGGSTGSMLKLLKIETEEEIQTRERERQAQQKGIKAPEDIEDQDEDVEPRKGLVSPARIQAKMKKKFRKLKKTANFEHIDRKFLKPIFTGTSDSEASASETEGSPAGHGEAAKMIELTTARSLTRLANSSILMQPTLEASEDNEVDDRDSVRLIVPTSDSRGAAKRRSTGY
ncbi:Na+/H+ antiporter [Klebsormidium nitens]|uniref:Na+/H+ antiporter n=1 Tax=Klebsormidium nitens TaxID=105231 RepID=A0A1Y1IQX8_KLENI|nr:Na+/H+ antiporter [Klebsormidium nitens]|eukprot:GAQ91037.1 Na+/H+ antiporter [Klebsormidium nitens]